MKKVRKTITADEFLRLWNNIRHKRWDKIMPNFWDNVKDAWLEEIEDQFRQAKRLNSYGPVNLELFKGMLQNTDSTFLPRTMDYSPAYMRRYPTTYVKTGFLRQRVQEPQMFENINESDHIGVRVKIPLKLAIGVKGGSFGYADLEEKRSFIKSSFILSWPKILRTSLESMVGK